MGVSEWIENSITIFLKQRKTETLEDNGLITQPSFKHFISLRTGDETTVSCVPAGSILTLQC